MSRYYGRINGVIAGKLTGFIIDTQFVGSSVPLDVVVGGHPAVQLQPDIRRLVRQPDEAGEAYAPVGFEFDLSRQLAESAGDLDVRITTADGTYELIGSPAKFGIAADAFLDPTRGGVICGWAHEAWFAKCLVELWSGDDFLLQWPADQNRDDLKSAGVGDGQCAFYIPLRLIYGERTPPKLQIKLPGRSLSLSVPPDTTTLDPPGRSVDDARPRAFSDLDEIYRGLDGEAAGAEATAEGGDKRLEMSFGTLQALLDRIEMLANERENLLAAARINRSASRAARLRPGSGGASPNRLEAELAAARAADASRDVRQIFAADYIPRAVADDGYRAELLNEIAGMSDSDMLAEIAGAFRGADLMGLSRDVLQRAFEVAPSVPLAQVAQWRNLDAWHALSHGTAHPDLIFPDQIRPVVPRRPATGRTLYCIWRSLPHEAAGYDTRSHYLLRGLVQVGENVLACTRPGFPWDGEATACPSFEVLDDITYVRLGSPGMRNGQLPLDRYLLAHANRIAHLASVTGADMIHSATNWLVGLPSLIAARRLGLPFVYEMRGLMEITRCAAFPDYIRSDHYALFRSMEAKVAASADLVFTITDGVRREMATRGCDTSRFRLAPNGVDCQRFRPLRRDAKLANRLGLGAEIVFGFIGSFLRYEGIDELCAAAQILKSRKRRFRILLVGDGPHAGHIRETIAAHGIADVVILTGRIPFSQVPQYYSLIDIAVFPRQGIAVTEIVSPLKPFEAMAMGKPVIASNVAALAEIVTPGETGWLFEKNDVQSLVDAMEKALGAPSVIERMGAAARSFVTERHDWPILAGRIAEGWHELRSAFRGSEGSAKG